MRRRVRELLQQGSQIRDAFSNAALPVRPLTAAVTAPIVGEDAERLRESVGFFLHVSVALGADFLEVTDSVLMAQDMLRSPWVFG